MNIFDNNALRQSARGRKFKHNLKRSKKRRQDNRAKGWAMHGKLRLSKEKAGSNWRDW